MNTKKTITLHSSRKLALVTIYILVSTILTPRISEANTSSSPPATFKQTKLSEPNEINNGKWELREIIDPLTDDKIPIAVLPAQSIQGPAKRIELQMECDNKREKVVFLDWGGIPLREVFRPGGIPITEIKIRFTKDNTKSGVIPFAWSVVGQSQTRNVPQKMISVVDLAIKMEAIVNPELRNLSANWSYEDFTKMMTLTTSFVAQAVSRVSNEKMTATFNTAGVQAAVDHIVRVCP